MTATTFEQHYLHGSLAPYVAERRLGATSSTQLFELAQPAGDFSDPPVSELLVCISLNAHVQRGRNGNTRWRRRIMPGDWVVVAPGTPTEVVMEGPNAFRVVTVEQDAARVLLQQLGRSGGPFDFGPLHGITGSSALVAGLAQRLWQEAGCSRGLGRLFEDAVLTTLLGELVSLSGRSPPRPARGGLSPRQLKQVTGYLEERLTDDVTLADLSALTGLSASHLCRAFKQSTGLPPHQWRQARRIERARELLASTGLAVIGVAAAVGYADAGQFATAFRKATGVSPSHYRKELVR